MIKRAVLLCLVLAACKSGQGDRCQVTDDCDAPLVCSKARNVCESVDSTSDIDGSVPDAPPADASVGDATADAP